MSLIPPPVEAWLRSLVGSCGAACFGTATPQPRRRLLEASAVPQLSLGRFEDEYECLNTRVGDGVGGPVLLAQHRDSGDLCVVKSLRTRAKRADELQNLVQEVYIHAQMNHPYIAKLLRVFEEPSRIVLVMEYGKGGPLSDVILRDGKISEERTRRLTRQLLEAVLYCHTHSLGRICHRDLKHANLVLGEMTEDAELKVIDFGLCAVLGERQPRAHGATGTLFYMAPEVVQKKAYVEACDLWSVGVIVYYCLCGSAPFFADSKEKTIAAIARGQFRPMAGPCWAHVSPEAKSFITSLLIVDAKKRPDAARALRHPWLLETAPEDRMDSYIEDSAADVCSVDKDCVDSDIKDTAACSTKSNESSLTRTSDESMPGYESTPEASPFCSDAET